MRSGGYTEDDYMTKCERCGGPMAPDDLVTCEKCGDELDAIFAPLSSAIVDLASDPVFLASRIADLEEELANIRDGQVVVMPVSVKHAEAMHLIATEYIRVNREEPKDV
jgi:hypothetical protein